MTERGHVSDEALLRLLDGELGAGERERVEGHLRGCAACAGRQRALGASFAEVREMLRVDAPVGDADRLRARVRVQMAATPGRSPAGLRWSLAAAALALPVVVAGMGWLVLRHQAEATRSAMLLDGLTVPDRRLTPGAIREVGAADLCQEGEKDFDPEVPASVQQAVFQEYGVWDMRAGEYQVDYLVSPQLGGTDSLENLWPEPYGVKVWNARAKDALERRLRTMVCEGQIDLPSAQQAIRVDWIAAYRRYVGGERP